VRVENFDALADLIASYPIIARTAHFILVPGPLDLTESPSSIYPRKQIFLPPTSRLKTRIPNIHFATNPCRVLFCGQEIVIFRDDLMARVMRNCVLQRKETSGDILRKYVRANAQWHENRTDKHVQLVQTIVDQGHLSPFTLEIQPTYWDFDHSLRLYPMPSTVSRFCRVKYAPSHPIPH
jgi:DNA polymerase epsilon subunit 2